MTKRRRARATVAVATVVALLAAAAVVRFQLAKDPTVTAVDLQVYRDAAADWLRGAPVYGTSYTDSILPFTYPPFALLAFAWLPSLSVLAAENLLLLLSITALLAISVVAVRAAGTAARARGPVSALLTLGLFTISLVLEPVTHTIDFGQINLLLCALVLLDCLVVPPRARGYLTGVAAAVKLTPGIFLLYFVVTGQRRAAVRVLVGAVAATIVTAAIHPAVSIRYWTSVVFENNTGPAISASNQNWLGVVERLLPTHDGGALALVMALDLATVVVGAGVIRRCSAAGHRVTAVAAAGLVGLLVSPVSWSHHWVWVVPLLAGLVLEQPVRGSRGLAAVVLAVFLAGAQWHVPHFYSRELDWTWWQVLAGNSYSICAVLVLLALAAAGQPPRRWSRTSPVARPRPSRAG